MGLVGNSLTKDAVSSTFLGEPAMSVSPWLFTSPRYLPVRPGRCCRLSWDQVDGNGLGEYLCACAPNPGFHCSTPPRQVVLGLSLGDLQFILFREYFFCLYGRGTVSSIYRVDTWSEEFGYFLKFDRSSLLKLIVFIVAHFQ